DLTQLVVHWTERADCSETLLGVVAMQLQVFLHQGIQQRVCVDPQGPLLDEDLSQRLGLFEDPGVHCAEQGVARDKVHLQCEDTEEQIAVGRHGRLLRARDSTHEKVECTMPVPPGQLTALKPRRRLAGESWSCSTVTSFDLICFSISRIVPSSRMSIS